MTRYDGNTVTEPATGISWRVWVDITDDGGNTGTSTGIHFTYGWYFSAPLGGTWDPISVSDPWGSANFGPRYTPAAGDHIISGPSARTAMIQYGGGNSLHFSLSATDAYYTGLPTSSVSFDYPLPARIPVPPDPPATSLFSATSSSAQIALAPPGNNGGAGIDDYMAYILVTNQWPFYGTGGNVKAEGHGGVTASGLTRHTHYYYTARAHNSAGWSGYTAMKEFWTLATVPDAPRAVTLSAVTQSTVYTELFGNSDGGSAITRWELGYGTDPTGPSNIVTSPITLTVSGLTPDTDYYFWSRGVNAIGTGPWSARSTARTLPGVHLRVSGAWVTVRPHSRVSGAWVSSKTHGRVSGAWS